MADDKNALKPEEDRSRGLSALLGRTFNVLSLATGAIGKWQRNLTADRREKIKNLFTVPRNDPNDPFKPNSEKAVRVISEQPLKRRLPPDEEQMLQTIAVHYDFCLPLDIVDWPYRVPEITVESREQLEKLPTWLKALILLRYEKILAYFGNRTHYFLRMLANRVDNQRSIPMRIFEFDENEDDEDSYTINKRFVVTKDEIDAPIIQPKQARTSLQGQDLFKVAHAIALWRMPKSARVEWDPRVVDRAAIGLRNAMLTQPSPAELALVAEDENVYIYDDESDEENLYKPQSWQEIISEKPEFREKIQRAVDMEFDQVPYEFRHLEEEVVSAKVKRRRERMKKLEEEERLHKRKKKWWKVKFGESRQVRRGKQVELVTRGLYRRYSRIWKKNCPMEEIAPTKRRAHHYRFDEAFHAYIVALVASKWFRAFIMFVIILNAIVLAFETGLLTEEYVVLSEVLDNLFLSIYLMEFIVKVYAHPQRYWRNGFNIFDFAILVVSIVKAVMDWLAYAEVNYLKVLVIVRALRILRGVSLNIQIQVLVTALVETLKTHVLSVIILLLLLMYISAIIAFYMFGEVVPKSWGNLGRGMLNLFAFVTMDGWTAMVEDFEAAGSVHGGRMFCLFGIVLGNFMFSNIFIAIIIMQISEATDSFRNKQRNEREAIVKRKKDTVYRRQKLDMRQLLARQKASMIVDFHFLATMFQKLLRHDDLVDIRDVPFSPMWMDCVQKCSQRCLHTANLLMNLHRQIADTLVELYEFQQTNKPAVKPIRRARYSRCVRLKAKLSLLKNEFYRSAIEKSEHTKKLATRVLKVRLPREPQVITAAAPPTRPTPSASNPPPPKNNAAAAAESQSQRENDRRGSQQSGEQPADQ